jgi:hypothetical protein
VQVITFEDFPTVPGELAFAFLFAMDPIAFISIAIHHSLLAEALSEVVEKVTFICLSVRPYKLAFAVLFTVRQLTFIKVPVIISHLLIILNERSVF